MTGKQRELAAIRHQCSDRIPADTICIDDPAPIAQSLGIEPAQVYEALGIDGHLASAWYVGPARSDRNGHPCSEWGTSIGGQFHDQREYPLASADSVSQIEQYPWPDPANYDYAKAAANARNAGATRAIRGPYWKPMFCQLCDLMGMEEAMVKMTLEPSIAQAALERIFAHTEDYCRRFMDAVGDDLDIFSLGDDFASQRGLMISPAQWREFLKPFYSRLFAMAKSRGKYVWFHSCGDITAVLPDLIDIGMDVWETVQLHTLPMSPRELKAQYGRHITFFGGISTQRLPFSAAQDVRNEVNSVIEALGEGGGFICGPDHHIKPDVPPPNTIALFDAARNFRRAGYTL